MNKLKILSIFIIIVLLLIAGCANMMAGGGSGAGNSAVVGKIYNESGAPSPNTEVTIIPESYNPVADGPLPAELSDTTDASGMFNVNVPKGTYNIQAVHLSQRTRLLIRGITADNDTITVGEDTLKQPGAAKIELPDTVDTNTGYIYLPGTILYQKLSEETLFYVNNTIHVIFDSIPAGTTPGIYFGREDPLFNPFPLTKAFTVTSNDTVNLTIQVEWFSYTTANSGLPDNKIQCVLTDDAGVLWIGTDMNGLATFDGTNWVVYTTQNSQLPNDLTRALAREPDGTIWVGTTGGVVSIKNGTWQAYTTANSGIPFNLIIAVAVDSAGNKWFGSVNGCIEFDGTQWKHHTGSGNDNIVAPNAIAADKEGVVMVGTEDGLFTYDNNQWEFMQIAENGSSYNSIQDITVDNTNTAWLATSEGLVSYRGGTFTIHDDPGSGYTNTELQSIATDWNNVVWIGTEYNGNIIRYGNPVVTYNGVNTGALNGVIGISDIDAYTENMVCFATKSSGIITVRFTTTDK
jgi:hypothetical protein